LFWTVQFCQLRRFASNQAPTATSTIATHSLNFARKQSSTLKTASISESTRFGLGKLNNLFFEIFFSQFSGEKRIQLVNDGCAIMPTDLVEADGRSFEWDTFRFRDSTNVFFNVKSEYFGI